MQIHLFGPSTSTGHSFRHQVFNDNPALQLFLYSRNPCDVAPGFGSASYVDLSSPESFSPPISNVDSTICISFAPIWLFATFLEYLESQKPSFLSGLSGLIACSSSSSVTKRFAVNRFDSDLSKKLSTAEGKVIDICERFRIPCRVLLPSLIYGRIGSYQDKNLSYIVKNMRHFPLLPVPSNSGLRQPIHASQLAALSLSLSRYLLSPGNHSSSSARILVGGDTSLSYVDMLRALKMAQPFCDKASRCKLVMIPNRLFFFLSLPLLLISPKAFEAVFRMGANLSGFTPVHQLTGGDVQPFPVLPLGK